MDQTLKISISGLAWNRIEAVPGTKTYAARIPGAGSGTLPLLDGGRTQQEQNAVV